MVVSIQMELHTKNKGIHGFYSSSMGLFAVIFLTFSC